MHEKKIVHILLFFLTAGPLLSHIVFHKDVLKALNYANKERGRKLQQSNGIVGILTLPVSKVLKNKIHQNILDSHSDTKMIDDLNQLEKMSFFPASYAKWMRNHNTQIVPIDIYSSDEDLELLMRSVDGILLTGGAVPLFRGLTKIKIDDNFSGIMKLNDFSFYTQKIKQIIELAKGINLERDNKYPVWGTCLGFEGLILAEVGFDVKFSDIENNNFNSNLHLETNDSELISYFNDEDRKRIGTQNIFFFNHDHAFFLSEFNANQVLRDNYRVVASADSKYFGKANPIVAIIESKHFPFYGVQFHPEKNKYESKITADRSANTLSLLDKFARFFCSKLGRETGEKQIGVVEAKLENYNLYVGSNIGVFDEVYIFQKAN